MMTVETGDSRVLADNPHFDVPRYFRFSRDGPLPEGLFSIRFDYFFNDPIPARALPSTLKHVEFGDLFNQEVSDGNIPENVESIIFGNRFSQPLDSLSIRNLKSVRFCDGAYEAVVPESLLPVMSDYYKSNYEMYKKMTSDHIEKCRKLGENLIPALPPPISSCERTNVNVELSLSLLTDGKSPFDVYDICARIEKSFSGPNRANLTFIELKVWEPRCLDVTFYSEGHDERKWIQEGNNQIRYAADIKSHCMEHGEYEEIGDDHEMSYLRLVDDAEDLSSEATVRLDLFMLRDKNFVHMLDICNICRVLQDTHPTLNFVSFSVNDECTYLTALVQDWTNDGFVTRTYYVGRSGTFYRVHRSKRNRGTLLTVDDNRVGPLTIEDIGKDV